MLNIENPGFKDFRSDASCTIRPQALIGEKYVDCLPTQPRVEGTPLPPPLQQDPERREGEGQYLLPGAEHLSPVDVDLLGDINRLPERQRFTIILNELGAGLAGRGSDLSEVIRRANPALQELDKVLAILASENHVLAKLAVDSDKALAAARRGPRPGRGLHRAEQHGRAGERRDARLPRAQPAAVPAVPRTARPRDGTRRALRRTDDARRSPT